MLVKVKVKENLITNTYYEGVMFVKGMEKYTEEGFRMFTDSTQWIEGKNIQELLDRGIEVYNKFDGMSPLKFMVQNIKPLEDIDIDEYTMEDIYKIKIAFNTIEEMNKKIFKRK